MIISKTAMVRLDQNNYKHYESKGYEIPTHINKQGKKVLSTGEEFEVLIEDLTKSSWAKVSFQCPECKVIEIRRYVDCNRVHCLKCHLKLIKVENNHCTDCGKIILKRFKLCRDCYNKKIRKNVSFVSI